MFLRFIQMKSLTFLFSNDTSSLVWVFGEVWNSYFNLLSWRNPSKSWNIDFHYLAKYLPSSEFLFMRRLPGRFMMEQLWQGMESSHFLDSAASLESCVENIQNTEWELKI